MTSVSSHIFGGHMVWHADFPPPGLLGPSFHFQILAAMCFAAFLLYLSSRCDIH